MAFISYILLAVNGVKIRLPLKTIFSWFQKIKTCNKETYNGQ